MIQQKRHDAPLRPRCDAIGQDSSQGGQQSHHQQGKAQPGMWLETEFKESLEMDFWS